MIIILTLILIYNSTITTYTTTTTGCGYVDDVLIDAPVTIITELLNSLCVSYVYKFDESGGSGVGSGSGGGGDSGDEDDGGNDNDYIIPREKGILRVINTTTPTTTDTTTNITTTTTLINILQPADIIERIKPSINTLSQRANRKLKSEARYYKNKYSSSGGGSSNSGIGSGSSSGGNGGGDNKSV